MERIKQVYDLYVARYNATPYTPRQGDVYKRIRAFLDSCDTVEIATDRMRSEGYNMETSCAVPADRVYAEMCAAREVGLDECAELCKKVYDQILADPSTSYQTGFYADIQRERDKAQRKLEAVSACFLDFMAYDIYHGFDEKKAQYQRNADALQNLGISLGEILKKKYYRLCLGCDDQYLQRFIDEYPKIVEALQNKSRNEAEQKEFEDEFKTEWEKIKDRKDELREIYKRNTAEYKFSLTLCKAPATADGDYEYTNESTVNIREGWV